MRTLVILSLLVSISLITQPSFSQMVVGLNQDSLKRVIATHPRDTLLVGTYIAMGQQLESNKPDSALYYYEQAHQLSEALHYDRGIIRYINNYTAVLNVQGKFDASLKLNLQALELCRKNHFGYLEAKALSNVAVVYQYKEDYASALSYYLKVLPIAQSFDDTQSLSMLYNNLCGMYRNLHQPEKALQYASLAKEIAEKDRDDYAISTSYINYGNVLQDAARYSEAILYQQKAYDVALRINDLNFQETALINLGGLYVKLKRPDQFVKLFSKALPLTDSLEDVSGKAYVLHGITNGLFQQRKFKEAERVALDAVVYTKAKDQKEVLGDMYMLLSDIALVTHRMEQAEVYRHQHDSIRQVLLNQSVLENVQEMETRYKVQQHEDELQKKNLQLKLRESEAIQQRNWLILSVAGILLLLVLLFLGFRFYQQRQLLNRQIVHTLQAEQESIRLKAQLDGQVQERDRISRELHDDLGTGLTTLLFIGRSLPAQPQKIKELSARITDSAGELIQKMNDIIWTLDSRHDSMIDLIGYVKSTAGRALADVDIDFDFIVEGTVPSIKISSSQRHNLYLIIKECVHNIIKHAEATMVIIRFEFSKALIIEIRDNGKGIPDDRVNGHGLHNLQLRATALGGTVTIKNENGTVLLFSLPLLL
jgi:signal transduction histidine kinase